MFGNDRFRASISGKSGLNQRGFIAGMEKELRAWAAMPENFSDDVTIMLIDIL